MDFTYHLIVFDLSDIASPLKNEWIWHYEYVNFWKFQTL